MTGHGNVIFSDAEAENLRNYLLGEDSYILMTTMGWINLFEEN